MLGVGNSVAPPNRNWGACSTSSGDSGETTEYRHEERGALITCASCVALSSRGQVLQTEKRGVLAVG